MRMVIVDVKDLAGETSQTPEKVRETIKALGSNWANTRNPDTYLVLPGELNLIKSALKREARVNK